MIDKSTSTPSEETTHVIGGGDIYYSKCDDKGNIELKRIINKRFGLMCPHCFNYVMGEMKRNVTLEAHIDLDHFFDISDHHHFMSDLCPFCQEANVDFIELDENITEAISLLNKKGYRTNFCCGGHIYEGKFDPGYIYFKSRYYATCKTENRSELIFGENPIFLPYQYEVDGISVPNLWKLDKKDWEKEMFIIRQKKGKIGERGIQNRIRSLINWINDLPEIPNEINETIILQELRV